MHRLLRVRECPEKKPDWIFRLTSEGRFEISIPKRGRFRRR
jgi:hypothetical protein